MTIPLTDSNDCSCKSCHHSRKGCCRCCYRSNRHLHPPHPMPLTFTPTTKTTTKTTKTAAAAAEASMLRVAAQLFVDCRRAATTVKEQQSTRLVSTAKNWQQISATTYFAKRNVSVTTAA